MKQFLKDSFRSVKESPKKFAGSVKKQLSTSEGVRGVGKSVVYTAMFASAVLLSIEHAGATAMWMLTGQCVWAGLWLGAIALCVFSEYRYYYETKANGTNKGLLMQLWNGPPDIPIKNKIPVRPVAPEFKAAAEKRTLSPRAKQFLQRLQIATDPYSALD